VTTHEAPTVLEARVYLETGRRIIDSDFDAGAPVHEIVRRRSHLYDALLERLFDEAREEVLRAHGVADSDLVLCAVGGYGRAELSPASDLDLLFLYPYESGVFVETMSERILYRLWDLGLEVGSAVRSINGCIRLARTDLAAYTSLLDHRFLSGDRPLYEEFDALLFRTVFSHGVTPFLEMRKREDERRRERYAGSIYLLEPHIKQGEGGLRDLHHALWAARVRFRVKGIDGLLRIGGISQRDADELRDAHAFLLAVREHLHRRIGRKQDRLTFDVQEEIARALGYDDAPGALAVEQFMQRYYRAASTVRRLAARILERCAYGQRKRAPPRSRPAGADLRVFEGALSVQRDSLFRARPVAMLEIFAESAERDMPVYAYAKDLVAEHLAFVDDAVRADPTAARLFLQMLADPADRRGVLSEMHDVGLLGAYVPEFGRLTGKHQHTLYHVYTVDAHTLAAIARLKTLHRGDLLEQEPFLSEAMAAVREPRSLYLGVLFHDIGKGSGRDHSIAGAEIATSVCRRFGLAPHEIDEVEFLVRHHLQMVKIATRRDLHDDTLLSSFCRDVRDEERLAKLYVLTYVDSITTGPNVWSDFKASLVRELYVRALAHLRGGESPETVAPDAAAPRARVRADLLADCGANPESVEAFVASLPDRYFVAFDASAARRHLRVVQAQHERGDTLAIERRHVPSAGHTELVVACADRPGLLALLAGAMAAERIDILGARIFTRHGGQALDVFYVRYDEDADDDAAPVWRNLDKNLRALLEGTLSVEVLVESRRRKGLFNKAVPRVPTRVDIDNTASSGFSVIDVLTEDRLGVLYLITKTLFELGLTIELSKVTTEANRVIDAFYVREVGGGKVREPARLAEIKERLLDVLAPDASQRPAQTGVGATSGSTAARNERGSA
jgi:[protein-PII] uridylyltransferase